MKSAPLKQIPTHIITGFLGSGKTTVMNSLLAQKPKDERWALLINEFGQIGIDSALIADQGDDVQIRELAGGCFCCALGPSLTITLAMLLRRAKPDRLLIEPSGFGHAAGLIEALQNEAFKDVLEIRSILCLLDPAVLEDTRTLQHPTFLEQLHVADAIVLNRCDLSSEALCEEAMSLSEQMFPPKQAVFRIERGHLPLTALDLEAQPENCHPNTSSAHSQQSSAQAIAAALDALEGYIPQPSLFRPLKQEATPQPQQPLAKHAQTTEVFSYGWIFHADDHFDYECLQDCLAQLNAVYRVKAAINLGASWISYNRVRDQIEVEPLPWRRDSRIECLSEQALDAQALEKALLACLKKASIEEKDAEPLVSH
ncbi:CobW family GTP-binding protein [Nitrincola tapanii]|uniref:GTP-binding protein n=1 Tax=Nitrincola tapanii TaxID=1708751 RepID=A0A5A9W387_9GAMM|nr:CobW family GTP-binding protein [Nitrincola tapanii]KAA0874964.1 GTP-binding protein [Nitrincola tapanii]